MDPALAIGPANHAGQAFEWCRAVRDELSIRALSFVKTDFGLRRGTSFRFPRDVALPHHRLVPGLIDKFLVSRLFRSLTHIALDGYLSPWGPPRSVAGLERAIDSIREAGRPVALIAHGSDVRDPSRHVQEVQGSYFASAPLDWVEVLQRSSDANRSMAARLDVPKFVSTPDLLSDVEGSVWLPVTTNLEDWCNAPPVVGSSRVRVLHLPSRRNPPIKGTDVIDPVLRDLHRRGKIDYVSPEGRVEHGKMVRLVFQADIVVDQIGTGSYGVAAAEAMSAGRLVVGDLSCQVRAAIPDSVPIVDAPPERFMDVMIDLIQCPDSWLPLAEAGRTYAAKWHSGAASADVLTQFLGIRRPGRSDSG